MIFKTRICSGCWSKGRNVGFFRPGNPGDADFYICTPCLEERDQAVVGVISDAILLQVFGKE